MLTLVNTLRPEDRFCYLRTVAGRTAAYVLVESRGSVPGCSVDHHHMTSDISPGRNRSRDVMKLPIIHTKR